MAGRRRRRAVAPGGDVAGLSRSHDHFRRLAPCEPGRGRHCAPVTHGRFITFEGGEGTGKSTQVARLVDRLRARDLEVLQTREPGGSEGAEQIRNLALNGDPGRWSAMTETLLMFAARSDHLERTIRPALAAGRWVVCDRFADSSRAYQGAGGGTPADFIETEERRVGKEWRTRVPPSQY